MERILTHNIIRSADRFPDRIAFKQLDQSMTFQELKKASFQLANLLIEIGVQKGDRIGVFMNRSFESAASIYGIMFAGAAYVPIDSNLPINRIQEIIDNCEIKIIISKPLLTEKIKEIDAHTSSLKYIIGIEENALENVKHFSWDKVKEFSADDPKIDIAEHDIAYIIYTSGTTGKPKGIVHTHYSGYSYAKLSAELYQLSEKDILGNHSHLHYDISTMGYLTMPYVGGCTIIIPEAYTIFPVSLGQLIEKEKMTIWYSVPLALIQLLKSGALQEKKLSALKWVLFGGEIFAIKYFKELFELLPEATFSNVYGPAEVNQCTYFNFDKNTILSESIPLGKAWPETQLKLFESNKTENEEVGELLVASSTRMKGYWNQESLTKQKNVSITDTTGNTLVYYKTGDLVKRCSDDTLLFIGRKDRQIKVRGHRVELNEIENVLLLKDNILEAAVYAKKHDDVYEVYVDIVAQEKSIDQNNIKNYLAKYLPKHAIPKHYRFVNSIPRTGAGKVDYKLLTT